MQLKQLLDELRGYAGIQHKKDISVVNGLVREAYKHSDHPNGDDTAAIKTDTGYDLLATEGFLSAFVHQDPWFAGWCSVMVNVSDVAAMGGRPTAIVNTIWALNSPQTHKIYEGMVAASQAFQVPIVGGHTNFQTNQTYLSASILGKAATLMSSFAAKPNDVLVAAIDLRGAFRSPFLNWNAATKAPAARLRADIALLPYIADNKLAHTAKDISQAGILGTCVMLLESSGVGAEISLDKIPKPPDVTWHDWLRTFPSYGYIFATSKDNAKRLISTFTARGISAEEIGDVTRCPEVMVNSMRERYLFWNTADESLTGMTDTSNKKQETTEVGTKAASEFGCIS